MFRFILLLFFIFFHTIIFFRCTDKDKNQTKKNTRIFEGYHVYLDSILLSKKGLIRGISLNVPPDTVLKYEKSAPIEKSPTRIYYEFPLDSATDYSVEYQFQNDSLSEIILRIYSTNLDLINYLYCDLKDYFSYIIPHNMEEKGYVIYNCVEGERRPFVISLSDISVSDKGIIQLNIYKD